MKTQASIARGVGMGRFLRSFWMGVVVMVASPSLCLATTFLDPSTLHIGSGAFTPCAVGCGGDPNIIPTTKLDIYQNSGGAGGLNNPVLLILAVANDPTVNIFGSTNPISSATFYNPYPGGAADPANSFGFATPGTYGLKARVGSSGGYFGSMTASSPDIYTFLTLDPPTNNSNSFVNMAAADLADDGITATSFGLYVFAITNTSGPLGANGLINITFGTALPKGTFAVAFGEDIANLKVYSTPFTESGLTGPNVTTQSAAVPEPASLLLLGSGLLLATAKIRKRKSSGLKSDKTKTSSATSAEPSACTVA